MVARISVVLVSSVGGEDSGYRADNIEWWGGVGVVMLVVTIGV